MSADLRALAEAATPGPWTVTRLPGGGRTVAANHWSRVGDGASGYTDLTFQVKGADAAHIAAWSPDRAIAALDVIEAARRTSLLTDERCWCIEWKPSQTVHEKECAALRAALDRWEALP